MELKKLIFNMWKTGLYQSKLDLITFLRDNYIVYKESEIIESVEDVLSNIDKYEIKFKQTKTEQFFIELLQLMAKYNVGIYAQSIGKDKDGDEDIRIFFETPDGTFGQDYYEDIDHDKVNTFEACIDTDDESQCKRYVFPAINYFKQEGITVRK